MVTERQRNFNLDMNDYIKSLPEKPPKKKKIDEIDELEEEQLKEAESKPGFFARLFGFLAPDEFDDYDEYDDYKEEYEEDYEQPAQVRKVVLKKPAAEKEVKYLAMVVDKVFDRLSKEEKQSIQKTKEYQTFLKIKQKYR